MRPGPEPSAPDSHSWRGESLAAVVARLRVVGVPALRSLSGDRLLRAWQATVDAFRDPASAERRELDRRWLGATRLSRAGLDAGVEVISSGVAGRHASELFERATPLPPGVTLVVLASNLPALLLQPLLPALARRRPLLAKSPSSEPHFAPAFLTALARREPGLGEAFATASWRGGDRAIEDPVLAAADRVLAYGNAATITDLERRAPGRSIGLGPKASLAVVAAGSELDSAAGIARDVALFDQRGCLSVQAVYTDGDAESLAGALAAALASLGRELPPGPPDPATALAVHQLRAEAELRGLTLHALELGVGTVVVDPEPAFLPSPGLRTVSIHPLPSLDRLPHLLEPWRHRLQGAALAGKAAAELEAPLRGVGVTRTAPPGLLQAADAGWHNGGIDPLDLV